MTLRTRRSSPVSLFNPYNLVSLNASQHLHLSERPTHFKICAHRLSEPEMKARIIR